jgi:hypothetical protein
MPSLPTEICTHEKKKKKEREDEHRKEEEKIKIDQQKMQEAEKSPHPRQQTHLRPIRRSNSLDRHVQGEHTGSMERMLVPFAEGALATIWSTAQ